MNGEPESVFLALTDKQHEALMMACAHLTSKQIAMKLGVAPVSIDKRIDGVRAKLGNISRVELLHLYQSWQGYDRTLPEPIILPPQPRLAEERAERIDDAVVATAVEHPAMIIDLPRGKRVSIFVAASSALVAAALKAVR